MKNKFFDMQETIHKIKQNMLIVNNRIKIINECRLNETVIHNLSKDLAKLVTLYFSIAIENELLHPWYLDGLFILLQPYCNVIDFHFDKDVIVSQYKEIRLDNLVGTITRMINFIQTSTIDEPPHLKIMYVLTTIFDSFL